MDAVQQQSHRPLKPMMDPHQHQDQNPNQHPPGVPWYPGQFQYQTSGAPPQQWVPSHHHNPSMDQSMQGQQQQQQQYAPGHGFNPIHDMYTQHQGQQHYPPPPQRPMPPHQVTHMVGQIQAGVTNNHGSLQVTILESAMNKIGLPELEHGQQLKRLWKLSRHSLSSHL